MRGVLAIGWLRTVLLIVFTLLGLRPLEGELWNPVHKGSHHAFWFPWRASVQVCKWMPPQNSSVSDKGEYKQNFLIFWAKAPSLSMNQTQTWGGERTVVSRWHSSFLFRVSPFLILLPLINGRKNHQSCMVKENKENDNNHITRVAIRSNFLLEKNRGKSTILTGCGRSILVNDLFGT